MITNAIAKAVRAFSSFLTCRGKHDFVDWGAHSSAVRPAPVYGERDTRDCRRCGLRADGSGYNK